LRTEFARLPSRHAAADPEGPGFVGSGKHNPTTDGNGSAAQRRVKQLLYGGIESIQVRMEDGGCRGHPDRSPVTFRRGSRREEHNENKDEGCQAISEDRADTGPDRKLRVALQLLAAERAIAAFVQLRQQPFQRCLDVANKTLRDRMPSPEVRRVNVDLDDLCLAGIAIALKTDQRVLRIPMPGQANRCTAETAPSRVLSLGSDAAALFTTHAPSRQVHRPAPRWLPAQSVFYDGY
jgi:hypothetical protein